MSTRHAPALLPSDLAPSTATGPKTIDRDESERSKVGAVRPATPEEYARAGLLAADHATDAHAPGSAAAGQLAAELLAMLGLTAPHRLADVLDVRARQRAARQAAARA